jgi:hypothetical protein
MHSGRFSMSRKKERIFERRYFGDDGSHDPFFMVESTQLHEMRYVFLGRGGCKK